MPSLHPLLSLDSPATKSINSSVSTGFSQMSAAWPVILPAWKVFLVSAKRFVFVEILTSFLHREAWLLLLIR